MPSALRRSASLALQCQDAHHLPVPPALLSFNMLIQSMTLIPFAKGLGGSGHFLATHWMHRCTQPVQTPVAAPDPDLAPISVQHTPA